MKENVPLINQEREPPGFSQTGGGPTQRIEHRDLRVGVKWRPIEHSGENKGGNRPVAIDLAK